MAEPGSDDEYILESGGLDQHRIRILNETKNVSSFVVIGQTLHKLYYEDKLMKTQKEFLEWTKQNLGFSKSTTYEYIISYRIYSEIASKIGKDYRPPMYQSHCQLLSKVPQKKLVEVWGDVCNQAPNGVITTAFLEAYLDKHNLRSKTGRISMHSSADTSVDIPGLNGDELDGDENGMIESGSVSGHGHSSQYMDSANNMLGQMAQLPINEALIFELSKSVVVANQFDMILQCVEDFRAAEPRVWYGRLWANLTSVRPLTTSTTYSSPASSIPASQLFEGGLEHLLRIIFTKFANKEFSEGLFLLRAEFGADWFTPILQHPYCILRHTNPPGPVMAPQAPPPSKRNKRSSSAANLNVGVPPAFESYVMFYLGPNIKDFCHVFRSIGLVPGINSWSAVMSVSTVIPPVGLMNVAGGGLNDDDNDEVPIDSDQGVGGQQVGITEAASALVDIART
ncbi:hypothetical protein HK101_008762 [Irineochytrium annulatum]|nr:hypothetical protein HK101_008762 [Irineochytrium annulatum]